MQLRYPSTRYEALQVRNDVVVSFCPVPYSAKIDLPVDNACDHQQGMDIRGIFQIESLLYPRGW